MLSAFGRMDVPWDTAENAGPDSLAALLQHRWQLSIACRSGRFEKSKNIVTDDDLLDHVVTFDEASQHWLRTQVTPRFTDQWEQFRANASSVLAGNKLWLQVVPLLLSSIANEEPEAKISFTAYNLANAPIMLNSLASGDPRFCPILEIVSEESHGTRVVTSRPVWTGEPVVHDAQTFFNLTYGSFEMYLAMRAFGEAFTVEYRALELAQLVTPIMEVFRSNGGNAVVSTLGVKRAVLERSPMHLSPRYRGLSEYLEKNSHFFRTWRMQVSM